MVATAPSTAAATRRRLSVQLDPRAAWMWVLTLGLVLYLGIEGGGYDLVVRSRVGVAIWWILIVAGLVGLRSAHQLGRGGTTALIIFATFTAWSTASTLWSLSSERSLDEASRLAMYLGVLWLALVSFDDRQRAIRHVAGALSVAIFVIAWLALLGRLHPGLFPGAAATGAALPGVRSRLSWPLNYWNALGALMAFGLPLLLAFATSARALWARCAAAAAIPAVVLCGYLTFSRTSAIVAVIALVVFLLLSPQRIFKVVTALICAAGGAALVAATVHRHAIENGLTTHSASSEGSSLLVLVIIACLVVGALQLGVALAVRRIGTVSELSVPRRPAGVATAGAVLILLVVAIALGAPHRLNHAYQDFKHPNGAHIHSDTIARFTALSGNGRYTYWKTGVDALSGRWPYGFGVGTFQLVWLPRAPFNSYVVNAHSLYVETLIEVGAVGLILLGAFLVTALTAAVRALRGVDPAARTFAAGAAAACLAFVVSAGLDWTWQVPVVPVAFLLLAAAALTPRADAAVSDRRPVLGIAARVAAVVAGLVCLGVIGTPLAMTEALRSSQTDANAGELTKSFSAARTAINIEPGAASPDIQAALVLELQRRFGPAVSYAKDATINEPQNWDAWLVLSRLGAESGNPALALSAFERAHSLNRASPLFRG